MNARRATATAAALTALLLAACQTTGNDTAPAAATPEPAPETTLTAAAPPQPEAAPAPVQPIPHIYMSLQSDGPGHPISVVFAIDASRDNTPSDDQAIRLTPDGGLCNPQEMRSYNFPPRDAAKPVVSDALQAQGLTAADLPAFLAVSVTNQMLDRSLATDREETRAHNICTRKLWEELVLAENQADATSQ